MLRFVSHTLIVWTLIAAFLVLPSQAGAQEDTAAGLQKTLDLDRKSLADISSDFAKLGDDDENVAQTLQSQRESLDKIRTSLAAILTAALPLRDAAKASVDKLGPPPKAGDPVENKVLSEERQSEQQSLDQLSALISDAQVQIKSADTLANQLIVKPFLISLAESKKTLDATDSSLSALPASGAGDKSSLLSDLRVKVDKVRVDLAALLDRVSPFRGQSQARLAKLPPPPKPEDPPESVDIAETRAKETGLSKQFNDLISSIQLQAARADDLASAIVDRQRSMITQALTARGSSAFSLNFWTGIFRDQVPGAFAALRYVFTNSANHFSAQFNSTSLAVFLLTIALGYAVARFLRFRLTRWRTGIATKRRSSRRFVGSFDAVLGIVHIMLGLPTASVVGILAFRFARLLPEYVLHGLGSDLIRAAFIGTGLWALARAMLAKDHPDLRLLPLSDWAVRRIGRRMGWLSVVLGISSLLAGVINSIGNNPLLVQARENLTAFLFMVITASLLMRLRSAPPTMVNGQPLPPDEDINALDFLRPISWVAVLIMALCLVLGYSTLAVAAAVLPLLLIGIVAASYLLTTLVDSALTDNLMSDGERRRAIAGAIGISPKHVSFSATLMSGVLRFLIVAFAILALGAPFGFYSTDMLPALQRAYFGFQLGEMTVSPSSIIEGIVILVGVLFVARIIRGWMRNTLLPRTNMDAGLQNSIATIVGYLGVILAVAIALSEIGISWQNVIIVAGGLSLGIGLGLQPIVTNFISGLILLAERPIRVGDIIAASGEEGYVRRISVRATEIETFDRATLIVPNSSLITSSVKNWAYGNTWSRLRISLSFPYDCDVDAVRATMLAAAEDDPRVLPTPPPRVFLADITKSALEFELSLVVSSLEVQLAVKSDLYLRLLKSLKAQGINMVSQVPAGPTPLLVSVDKDLETALAARFAGEAQAGGKAPAARPEDAGVEPAKEEAAKPEPVKQPSPPIIGP